MPPEALQTAMNPGVLLALPCAEERRLCVARGPKRISER